jgi:membrane protein
MSSPMKETRGNTADASSVAPTAAGIMTESPSTCSSFSTITEAALIFRDHDCGAVPVLEDGKPVGILTDRDIALAIGRYPDLAGRPVSDIMTRETATVPADASLEDVKRAFGIHAVRRLLVVDHDGLLVGIIAWADLVQHLPPGEIGLVASEVIEPSATFGPGASPPRPTAVAHPGPAPRPGEPSSEGGWKKSPRAVWDMIKETVHDYLEDKVPRLGAALAFYSVLSLSPILIIAITIAGLIFGAEAARGHLVAQIRGLVGQEGGKAIESMISHANKPGEGMVASIFGVLTLIVGATGVVGQLQDALNTIWEVAPKPGRGLWGFVKDRFLSLALVFGIGFLLLVSLVLSTAMTALGSYFGGLLSRAAPGLEVVNFAVSVVVITLLFAMMYKLLPDVRISWGDVWVGAVMTSILFVVGKTLIGLYLGRSGLGSTYGAAGSLAVLLVWVYYSAQILFFGAEFTKVYAAHFGSLIVPARDAVPVTEEARAQQGIPRTEDVARASARPSSR